MQDISTYLLKIMELYKCEAYVALFLLIYSEKV